MKTACPNPLALAALALAALTVAAAATTPLAADTGKVPEGLKDLNAEGADLWIYNDIEAAREKARELDRPLFVTFRCIPCAACKSFDAEVAKGSGRILDLARDKFVAVRQVEMKGVDLNQFRFDYDLNWAAMFIHPDGTVLGRYGTQSAEGPDAYNSIDSLEAAMRRVLALHAAYPGNRAELSGKRPPEDPDYRSAFDLPGLENKDNLRGPTRNNNCIHCHNIHDAEQLHAHREGRLGTDLLHRYPLPENLGLRLDRDHGLRVASVEERSAADRAGLRAGHTLTHAGGQALTSIADLQWVLHNLPPRGAELALRYDRTRTGDGRPATLQLAGGWKKTDFSWRGSMWGIPPRIRIYFPEAKPEKLAQLDLPKGRTALEVKWINRSAAAGRAAEKAGLRHGDLVVKVGDDAIPAGFDHRKLNMLVKANYGVGDKLPLTVVRGGRQRVVKIPLLE